MLKSKSFYVSAVCVISAIAVVTITSMGINSNKTESANDEKSYLKNDNNEDKAEDFLDISDFKEDNEENMEDNYVFGDGKEEVISENVETGNNKKEDEDLKAEDNKNNNTEKKDDVSTVKPQNQNTVVGNEDGKSDISHIEASQEAAVVPLTFDEEAGLLWPIEGDILMKFSENGMVYYKTLGQFMKSDKILIGAAVGDKVKAAAEGKVTEIGNSRETGNYIKMSIGSGYSVVYGELDKITVKKGDKINVGQVIATVAAPSGYYSGEGTNLYFKVEENGEPVNPMYLLK